MAAGLRQKAAPEGGTLRRCFFVEFQASNRRRPLLLFQRAAFLFQGSFSGGQGLLDFAHLNLSGQHFVLRVPDFAQHRPAGKNVVEEIVCKAQKTVDLYLKIGANHHVGQFGLISVQLELQFIDALLGIVDMVIFGYVCQQPAAPDRPRCPNFGRCQIPGR